MSAGKTFGQWLKQRRKELDLTQEDLAERVGCSMATIEKIEGGTRRPSRQVAELLATYLEIAPDERTAFTHFARASSDNTSIAPVTFSPAPLASALRDGNLAAPAIQRPALRIPNNLPVPLTPLIGREKQVAEVRERLMDAGIRLLTLTGPPGIGKTRLSLQAAEEMLDAVGTNAGQGFEDGVYFVELSPVADPAQVAPAIARTLGVREAVDRPLQEGLKQHLRDRHMLLILDNFEQVAAAAPLVSELLRAARRLKIIVTSRVVLHVYGEHDFPVPPLELPAADDGRWAMGDNVGYRPYFASSGPIAHHLSSKSDPGTIARFPAVRLFTERASALKPGFSLTADNARTVALICQGLEGLPLAIELAAARIRMLSPDEILARLGDRLRLLSGGPVDLPDRQRALTTAIDWSYNLLSDDERAVFGQLSVFAGGWTLEAADAVLDFGFWILDSEGEQIQNPKSKIQNLDVFELLAQLADKSLVVIEEKMGKNGQGGYRRYRMLETIREYARTKLTDARAFDRMARYYVGYVEAHPTYYETLDPETPNVLAALQAASHSVAGAGPSNDDAVEGMADVLVRGANAFYHFLETRGLYGLAETQLQRAEEAARATRDSIGLATTLLNLGRASEHQGNYARAEGYYQEGLALARSMQNPERTGALLQNLGGVVIRRGDYAQAESYLAEGLEIARQIGDSERVSAILGNLGTVAFNRGDYAQAEARYAESLEMARAGGNKERICALLQGLGAVATNRGDYAGAQAYFEEGLAIAREIGHRERTSFLLMNLGAVSNTRGEYGRAEAYYLEGLQLAREIEDRDRISDLLRKLGELASERGNNARAEGYLLEGLDLARALDHRERISGVLSALGVVASRRGDNARAELYFSEGLDLAHAIGHRRLTGSILNEWGELHMKAGRLESAAAAFSEALEIAHEVGSQDLIATALYGLARTAAEIGQHDRARQQGHESLALFEAIGHNKVGEVNRWLASAGY